MTTRHHTQATPEIQGASDPSPTIADRLHGEMTQAYCLADALKWLAETLEITHGTGPVFILEGLSEKAAALGRNLEALGRDLPEVEA